MKKILIAAFAAASLVGCATNDSGRYEGAPSPESDVIYGTERDPRSPSGLDYPSTAPEPLPPAIPPSGNRLRGLEPAPSHPTEAVPPY